MCTRVGNDVRGGFCRLAVCVNIVVHRTPGKNDRRVNKFANRGHPVSIVAYSCKYFPTTKRLPAELLSSLYYSPLSTTFPSPIAPISRGPGDQRSPQLHPQRRTRRPTFSTYPSPEDPESNHVLLLPPESSGPKNFPHRLFVVSRHRAALSLPQAPAGVGESRGVRVNYANGFSVISTVWE